MSLALTQLGFSFILKHELENMYYHRGNDMRELGYRKGDSGGGYRLFGFLNCVSRIVGRGWDIFPIGKRTTQK